MTISDTLSSIFMNMSDLGDGRVLVEWNPTSTPQNNGEPVLQNIMREYPAGTWVLREQIPYGQFTYKDTIDICNGFVNYKIEIPHNSGCLSGSNIKGDLLQDIINPFIPVISSVSVDIINGFTVIDWDQNHAPDTYGYIIVKLVNGFWENIDTVYGIGTNSYNDLTSLHDSRSETYLIEAFDSCVINNVPPNFQLQLVVKHMLQFFSQRRLIFVTVHSF